MKKLNIFLMIVLILMLAVVAYFFIGGTLHAKAAVATAPASDYPDVCASISNIVNSGAAPQQFTVLPASPKDCTLVDMTTGREKDMGSPFDYFSEISHPDYRGITDEQYANRMNLQRVMKRCGFGGIDCEWWHFTLLNEPYPDTYFEFPVSSQYLRR